jgi:hypothetical protein
MIRYLVHKKVTLVSVFSRINQVYSYIFFLDNCWLEYVCKIIHQNILLFPFLLQQNFKHL